MNRDKKICITIDQDWCHDQLLNYGLELFSRFQIPVTVFVTDFSKKWYQSDFIEIGAHVNFEKNSTQGNSIDEIILNANESIENCRSFRSHSLLTSTRILDKVSELTNWDIESNVYLRDFVESKITQFPGKRSINRMIINFEDDIDMRIDRWPHKILDECQDLDRFLLTFDFHPIHIFLNSQNMKMYEFVKSLGLVGGDVKELLKFQNDQSIQGTYYHLLEFLTQCKSRTDIYFEKCSDVVDGVVN